MLAKGYGFCIPKAALARRSGQRRASPAGFGDVPNHLTSPRLRDMMNLDLFAFHGYAELLIDGRWAKATPAFKLSLCEKVSVKPLEFDGRSDSIFHEFDALGRRHMEYVRERGSYSDVPREEIVSVFQRLYPNYRNWVRDGVSSDFEREDDTGTAR